MRLDALEVGEIESQISVENALEQQGRCLRQYRDHLNAKRRELIRGRLLQVMEEIDGLLQMLLPLTDGSLFRSVAAGAVRRCTHKFNPICRRFLSGSALGAKFEVVVRVVSALEVTLRHHRVAFQAKMFVSHRRSPSELRLQVPLVPGLTSFRRRQYYTY
jgi:hypothetical protein